MNLRTAKRALFLWIASASAATAASTLHVTVDTSKLGEGKNSIHYFESGGILYGYLQGGELSRFELETKTHVILPMKPVGEPSTSKDLPAGSTDQLCTLWTQRCWYNEILKINLCANRCLERKDAKTGESTPVTSKTEHLAISSPAAVLK